MGMARISGFAIALLAFAGLAFAAQSYRDPKFGFLVAFPDGWQISVDKPEGGLVVALLPSPRTVCSASAQDNPELKLSTQAQIDAMMKEPFGLEFWGQQNLFGAAKIVVQSHGVRNHPSGRTIQEAVIVEPAATGQSVSKTAIVAVLLTPGVTHVVLCLASSSDFAAMKPQMAGVIESYRPKSDDFVSVGDAMLPGNAALAQSAASAVSRARAEIQRMTANDLGSAGRAQ